MAFQPNKALTAENALIFRITHRDNVPWVLENGLHCRNSDQSDPNYVNIGSPDLIGKRQTRAVPVPPCGTLSDYIPFYFTPHSPMLYNIRTGYGGITQRANEEIVILGTSLHKLAEHNLPYVFTDRHAYLRAANYYNSLDDLVHIDFPLLQSRNFRRDPENPERIERYQAEALVHGLIPVDALMAIVSSNISTAEKLTAEVQKRDLDIPVVARIDWYF